MKTYVQNFWVRFLACILCSVTLVAGATAGICITGIAAFSSREEMYENGKNNIAENYAAYIYDHLDNIEKLEKFLENKNFDCSVSKSVYNIKEGEVEEGEETVVFTNLVDSSEWDYQIEILDNAHMNYNVNSALDALRIVPIIEDDDTYTIETPITGYVYDAESGLFYYHAKEISTYFLADYILVSYDGSYYDYKIKNTADGNKFYYNSFYNITLDTSTYQEWDWVEINGVRLNISQNGNAQGKEIPIVTESSSIQPFIYTGMYYDFHDTIAYYPDENTQMYTIRIKVDDLSHVERVSDDLFYEWKTICDDFFANEFIYQQILVFSIILFVLSFALLIYSANDKEESIGFTQRVPVGIFTACIILLELPLWVFAHDFLEGTFDGYSIMPFDIWLILCMATAFAVVFLVAVWLQNIISRLKTKTFIQNSEFHYGWKILKWIWQKITLPFKAVWNLARENTPLFIKGLVFMLVISFVELMAIVICWWNMEIYLILFFFAKIIEIPLFLAAFIQMQRLQDGSGRIAAGDLSQPIDTRRMFWEFKKHGENINKMSDGISLAVEERMKSERFKTELITNVSHDIKTPLTSIINYVDLIKKEEIPNETVKEYVEVLDRQSARLKKLIEDLMEASKASTGNMTVYMEDCDVEVLLTQLIGEFEDKLTTNQLEVVLQKPEHPVIISADGRHMWRVLDNLLNNACKYSLPGTRVYISLVQTGYEAKVTFKNISKAALNIPSDELMERFVRGDSSRNTEGSGLGLSIAQSLTELMKGSMKLEIDGDLFKVMLTFHTIIK